MEETRAAAWPELWGGVSPQYKARIQELQGHSMCLGGVTANTAVAVLSWFLKLLADLREGFVKQRTDPGRWVVQGMPRPKV